MKQHALVLAVLVLFTSSPLRARYSEAASGPDCENQASAPSEHEPPRKADGKATTMEMVVHALSGTWSMVEVRDPTQKESKPTAGHDREVWRTSAGGLVFIEEYVSASTTGNANELAFIWWDKQAQLCKGQFCSDFVDEGCSDFDVNVEPEQIVMTGQYHDGGTIYSWREVFSSITATSFDQTLYVGRLGEQLKKLGTLRATRLASNAEASSN